MKMRMLRAIPLVLRVLLGVIFIWAAIAKAMDVPTFIEEIGKYRVLPETLGPAFAIGLIGVESAAAIMLLAGIRIQIAAGAMAVLLIAFIIALSQALLRRLDLTCGCFGGEDPASWWTVGRDIAMLAACIAIVKIGWLKNALLPKKSSAKAGI